MSAKPRSACRNARRVLAIVVEQHRHRGVAGGRDGRVTPGVVQRMPQQPRAHRGDAVVEQAAQRRRRLATQGFGEFEIASGRRVEAEESGIAFDDQRPQVRQGARLRRLRIAQQGAGSGNRRPQAVGTETSQRAGGEMRTEFAAGGLDVEMPVRLTGQRHVGR
jgi:hypothetical protein